MAPRTYNPVALASQLVDALDQCKAQMAALGTFSDSTPFAKEPIASYAMISVLKTISKSRRLKLVLGAFDAFFGARPAPRLSLILMLPSPASSARDPAADIPQARQGGARQRAVPGRERRRHRQVHGVRPLRSSYLI